MIGAVCRWDTDTGFVPELLRTYRRDEGWTQAELALRAGVLKSQICLWETGALRPSTDSIDRLVAALGISRAALCDGDEET